MARRKAGQGKAEGRLFGLFEDLVQDGSIVSFCEHAGIPFVNVAPDQAWPNFRKHYASDLTVDEERVATDLATWGPIASRVVELQLRQGRGHA
jgi:hypothetical protein